MTDQIKTTKCRICNGTGRWGPFAAGMAAAEAINRMTPNERMAASSPCGICGGTGAREEINDVR
jgi:endogenous inhibitor of DNA gyrase (YacG/DUF329 family)